MYTNGNELYTVQARFVRGPVLRITLGGLTDENKTINPVYLVRVTIATGAPVVVAGQGVNRTGADPSGIPGPRTVALADVSAAGPDAALVIPMSRSIGLSETVATSAPAAGLTPAPRTKPNPIGQTAEYSCGLMGYSKSLQRWDLLDSASTVPVFNVKPTPQVQGTFVW